MATLTHPVSWRIDAPRRLKPYDLTTAEQANTKAALRVLARRFGGFRPLAVALAVNYETLHWSVQRRGHPTAGIALRAARLAVVHVEDVLTGAFPKAGSCPRCGRC